MGTQARAVLLILIVLCCSVQLGDGSQMADLRVRAGICHDRTCNTRTQVAFAPAHVNVQVYLRQHPGNRYLSYGLVCDSVIVAESQAQVDGDGDPPLFIRDFRDVGAGGCQAVAILTRVEGTITARSERLLIQSRLEEP